MFAKKGINRIVTALLSVLILVGCGEKTVEGAAESRCYSQAKNYYSELYTNAIADPSLWQLGGYKSAHDYADGGQRRFYSKCLEWIPGRK